MSPACRNRSWCEALGERASAWLRCCLPGAGIPRIARPGSLLNISRSARPLGRPPISLPNPLPTILRPGGHLCGSSRHLQLCGRRCGSTCGRCWRVCSGYGQGHCDLPHPGVGLWVGSCGGLLAYAAGSLSSAECCSSSRNACQQYVSSIQRLCSQPHNLRGDRCGSASQVFGPYVPLLAARRYSAHVQVAANRITRMNVNWVREGDGVTFGATSIQVRGTIGPAYLRVCAVEVCAPLPPVLTLKQQHRSQEQSALACTLNPPAPPRSPHFRWIP